LIQYFAIFPVPVDESGNLFLFLVTRGILYLSNIFYFLSNIFYVGIDVLTVNYKLRSTQKLVTIGNKVLKGKVPRSVRVFDFGR
jgi:hypothetical protein